MVVFLSSFLMPVALLSAQTDCTDPTRLCNPIKFPNLSSFLLAIINVVIQYGAILVVFFIVFAGFKFVTAQGNSEKISEARKMLTWVVVGAFVLLGVYVIRAAVWDYQTARRYRAVRDSAVKTVNYKTHQKPTFCHSRGGGNPDISSPFWIPFFKGMTKREVLFPISYFLFPLLSFAQPIRVFTTPNQGLNFLSFAQKLSDIANTIIPFLIGVAFVFVILGIFKYVRQAGGRGEGR